MITFMASNVDLVNVNRFVLILLHLKRELSAEIEISRSGRFMCIFSFDDEIQTAITRT